MLNHFMCEQTCFPCCQGADGVPVVNAKIFQKNCAHSDCAACNIFAASDKCVLSCPTLFNEGQYYKWKEFQEHTLDNGHKIKELRPVGADLNGFRAKFTDALATYKKHYFTYRWLNLCRKVDMFHVDGSSIYIQTDYSAQPALDSQDKLNSQGHGVCVLSCWLVIHSPQRLFYLDKNNKKVFYTYFECDHVRVVSPSTGKGKDQDWYLHCKIFDKLLVHYKTNVVPNMTKCMVWTDGAVNQYKCSQNFLWVARAWDLYGIQVIHRFGATAQFKGVHDKIGQVAKWVVK
jgi:hypothetical protein